VLVDQIVEMLDRLDDQPPHPLRKPVTVEWLDIRCQRTWHEIPALNDWSRGGAYSACIAHVTSEPLEHVYALVAHCPMDSDEWSIAMFQGGPHPQFPDRPVGGVTLIAMTSWLCVGTEVGTSDVSGVKVALPDGTVYEDAAFDGCAMVFAPFVPAPQPGDHASVSYVNSAGETLGSSQIPIAPRRPLL
jgi:hypothetical protein